MSWKYRRSVAIKPQAACDVILSPVITEKATMGSEFNQVTFRVPLGASKPLKSTASEWITSAMLTTSLSFESRAFKQPTLTPWKRYPRVVTGSEMSNCRSPFASPRTNSSAGAAAFSMVKESETAPSSRRKRTCISFPTTSMITEPRTS